MNSENQETKVVDATVDNMDLERREVKDAEKVETTTEAVVKADDDENKENVAVEKEEDAKKKEEEEAETERGAKRRRTFTQPEDEDVEKEVKNGNLTSDATVVEKAETTETVKPVECASD